MHIFSTIGPKTYSYDIIRETAKNIERFTYGVFFSRYHVRCAALTVTYFPRILNGVILQVTSLHKFSCGQTLFQIQ